MSIYPLSLLVSLALSFHGYRKGSLSLSGSISACLVGYVSLSNPHPLFGTLLLVFYLVGSKATKVKADIKKKLEREVSEERQGAGEGRKEGGNRTAVQVLCNSFTAVLASMLYRFGNDIRVGGGAGEGVWLLMTIGHYSACMGDTLASELGILSRSKPRLIIRPWQVVPRGTNGGVSPWGTLVSILGGTLIGLTTVACSTVSQGWTGMGERECKVVILATIAGFVGSMLDSILGATLQQTLYSSKHDQVLIGRLPSSSARKDRRDEWKVVTGYDVFSNNSVNFISSFLTALGTAYLGKVWEII